MPKPTRRQLVQRRRYRQVRIQRTEATLAQFRADVVRLDGAIEAESGAVRAYALARHPASRGGVAKACRTCCGIPGGR